MEETKLPRGSTQPRERGQPGQSCVEREGSVKVPRCPRKKGRLKKSSPEGRLRSSGAGELARELRAHWTRQ